MGFYTTSGPTDLDTPPGPPTLRDAVEGDVYRHISTVAGNAVNTVLWLRAVYDGQAFWMRVDDAYRRSDGARLEFSATDARPRWVLNPAYGAPPFARQRSM